MELSPYLNFPGTCEEALNFYAKCLGGTVEGLNRFAGSPMESQVSPDWSQKVMHATLKAGDVSFMASDPPPSSNTKYGDNISLCIATNDVPEGERIFNALSAGGSVDMPFADAFWGGKFGMFTDKYGVAWMVSAGHGQQ